MTDSPARRRPAGTPASWSPCWRSSTPARSARPRCSSATPSRRSASRSPASSGPSGRRCSSGRAARAGCTSPRWGSRWSCTPARWWPGCTRPRPTSPSCSPASAARCGSASCRASAPRCCRCCCGGSGRTGRTSSWPPRRRTPTPTSRTAWSPARSTCRSARCRSARDRSPYAGCWTTRSSAWRRPAHRRRPRARVSLRQAARLPLIGFTDPTSTTSWSAGCAAPAASRRFVFRSNDNPTIQGFVAAGLGYAVMPRLTVDEDDPQVAGAAAVAGAPGPAARRRLARRPAAAGDRDPVHRARGRGVRATSAQRLGRLTATAPGSGVGRPERGQGAGPVAGPAAELDLAGHHPGLGAQQPQSPAYQRQGRLAVLAQVAGAAGAGSS